MIVANDVLLAFMAKLKLSVIYNLWRQSVAETPSNHVQATATDGRVPNA